MIDPTPPSVAVGDPFALVAAAACALLEVLLAPITIVLVVLDELLALIGAA